MRPAGSLERGQSAGSLVPKRALEVSTRSGAFGSDFCGEVDFRGSEQAWPSSARRARTPENQLSHRNPSRKHHFSSKLGAPIWERNFRRPPLRTSVPHPGEAPEQTTQAHPIELAQSWQTVASPPRQGFRVAEQPPQPEAIIWPRSTKFGRAMHIPTMLARTGARNLRFASKRPLLARIPGGICIARHDGC